MNQITQSAVWLSVKGEYDTKLLITDKT